jgi:hypothetical protein
MIDMHRSIDIQNMYTYDTVDQWVCPINIVKHVRYCATCVHTSWRTAVSLGYTFPLWTPNQSLASYPLSVAHGGTTMQSGLENWMYLMSVAYSDPVRNIDVLTWSNQYKLADTADELRYWMITFMVLWAYCITDAGSADLATLTLVNCLHELLCTS